MNRRATELRIGGIARLSSCDWPGELAATIFCQGCAWDCAYCHNPSLRKMRANEMIPWSSILAFLSSRRGLLDAVVFSGGEPTLQSGLLDAVNQVRKLGFRIGLHTAGMVPERFAALLPSLDWVGFDFKAPSSAYSRITGVDRSGEKALESLRHLLASRIPYEVRTTVHSHLLGLADMRELKTQLLRLGVENFVVQQFRPQGTRPERLSAVSQPLVIPQKYSDGFLNFQVR